MIGITYIMIMIIMIEIRDIMIIIIIEIRDNMVIIMIEIRDNIIVIMIEIRDIIWFIVKREVFCEKTIFFNSCSRGFFDRV